MKSISSVEVNGSTFIFEPPVPMPDNEPSNPSLARVATLAWYGAEHPSGIGQQLAEEGFDLLVAEASQDPQVIATKVTEALQNQTQYTVTLTQ